MNWGYYPDRKDEEDDFLYVMSFNGEFIKIGRSFKVNKRKDQLSSLSGFNNIVIIKLYKSNHELIYKTEQEVHGLLRDLDMQYSTEWSSETFKNECLPVALKFLDLKILPD